MNVTAAWKMGYTGKGVVVSILDDGIEKNHPDLAANYDPIASYDINDNDYDPQPRYNPKNENKHGTRCAGEVAAVANNSNCIVGVAYHAKIGGVRMLDGDITDAVEAQSLSLASQHIDVYSASWGPDDDGKTVDGPSRLAKKAFFDGVTYGRNGLGSIYVWASGNGGRYKDNCNCDGYTNSRFTLSIGSATEDGEAPWYSEACSSTLASTYSSGRYSYIISTDLRHGCTDSHTGTSASAPLAAGLIALALEANRKLTWRDMQHIVVRTARKANLHSQDWNVNGVGLMVSHAFGFGLMDAGAMVSLGLAWKTVPRYHKCIVKVENAFTGTAIQRGSSKRFQVSTTGCSHQRKNHVKFLEHVEAYITLQTAIRGNTQIFLVSPMGTRSKLLATRQNDQSSSGFSNWPFMTVHNWGEISYGIWTLEIYNYDSGAESFLNKWTLVLYGTATDPLANNNDSSSVSRDKHFKPGLGGGESSAGSAPTNVNLIFTVYFYTLLQSVFFILRH